MTAVIYCPFPDKDSARKAGETLLDEGLIGCINIGSAIESLFIWNGERGTGSECPALLKTDARLLKQAIERLGDLHPYEAPAIVGWPCMGAPATQSWLAGLDGGISGGKQQ